MNDDSYYRNKVLNSGRYIPDPCERMKKLGYTYTFRRGLVDETPYYTRVEEDTIIYTGDNYSIQFNLGSRGIVLVMNHDNAEYYGDKPTFFVSQELIECIDEIMRKLGWRE